MFLALLLYRPSVRMWRFRPSSPSASILAGVSATANSSCVALFTPTSVAWAESTTATRSVKGVVYSSSPLGCGSTAARRSKNSAISVGESSGSAMGAQSSR